MTDTSKDAVDRLVLAMIRSGNTTGGHYWPDPTHKRDKTEYRRADLPPTISAAMELPEVRALVERLDNPWAADDGIEKGAAPLWCGQYMQEAKHALTAALDEIERLREENATLRTEKHADAEAIGALQAERDASVARADALADPRVIALVGAVKRQGDNMAFLLNHAPISQGWYDKFTLELEEDRSALAAIKEPKA